MIYDFVRLAGLPAKTRAATVYRDVRLWPICLGHLRLLDLVLPGGVTTQEDCALVASLLAVSPRIARRRILRGRLPASTRRFAPRDDEERAALLAYLAAAWKCPDRYREQSRHAATRGPHEREYASSAALRLMARLARIPGVTHLLEGHTLEDVPVQDALAWVVADDELNGAHYMSRDTDEKFSRKINARNVTKDR